MRQDGRRIWWVVEFSSKYEWVQLLGYTEVQCLLFVSGVGDRQNCPNTPFFLAYFSDHSWFNRQQANVCLLVKEVLCGC